MAANVTTEQTASAPAVASRVALRPATGRGWSLGFVNLFSNEARRWFGTRRWLLHLILWPVLINGLIALVAAASGADGLTPAEAYAESGDVFTGALAITTAIGVVAVMQGAIIGEKQLGTAAWVMSKPASRSAFVLAKLAANGGTLLVLAVLVPSALYYVEALAFFGQAPALGTFAAAVGLIVLHLLFYLALTAALGTLFSGRGAVMGIGVGLIVAGLILGGALRPLALVLPWPLNAVARGLLTGQALPDGWPLPVMATAVWVVVLVGLALRRFSREEF